LPHLELGLVGEIDQCHGIREGSAALLVI
jgi:hypothetical protein